MKLLPIAESLPRWSRVVAVGTLLVLYACGDGGTADVSGGTSGSDESQADVQELQIRWVGERWDPGGITPAIPLAAEATIALSVWYDAVPLCDDAGEIEWSFPTVANTPADEVPFTTGERSGCPLTLTAKHVDSPFDFLVEVAVDGEGTSRSVRIEPWNQRARFFVLDTSSRMQYGATTVSRLDVARGIIAARHAPPTPESSPTGLWSAGGFDSEPNLPCEQRVSNPLPVNSRQSNDQVLDGILEHLAPSQLEDAPLSSALDQASHALPAMSDGVGQIFVLAGGGNNCPGVSAALRAGFEAAAARTALVQIYLLGVVPDEDLSDTAEFLFTESADIANLQLHVCVLDEGHLATFEDDPFRLAQPAVLAELCGPN